MAYNFQYLFDEWAPNGVKTAPSIALKSTGFVGEMRAPAPVFNYQWDKIGRAITELQKVAITEDPSGGVWGNLSAVATSGSWNDLLDKPNFHAISTSGSYNDLEDAPTTWAASKITGMTEWLTANNYREFYTGSYSGSGTTNDTPAYASSITTKGRTISLPCTPAFLAVFWVGNGDSGYKFLAQDGKAYFSHNSTNYTVAYLSGNKLYVVCGGSSYFGCDCSNTTYNWFAWL